MTDEEMDRDLAEAAGLLARAGLRVDRCRHESVEATALWVFDGVKQIGSVSRVCPDWYWKANRMHRGMPTSQRYFPYLHEAIAHITDGVVARSPRE